jgi:hypothetical protein
MPACDYYAIVSRWTERSRADIWPIHLRERLPVIPVPLRQGEREPTLDLQAALHRVYDAAAYQLSIYGRSPEPHLSPEDAAWSASILARAEPPITAPG